MDDSKAVAELALLLWPDNEISDLEKEITNCIASKNEALFTYFHGTIPVAFAQCSLRNDYVEGAETSPVGYLEGIYVKDEYRNKGIAKQLLMECEKWAKDKGCSEFASDCELNNIESLRFHLSLGFEEANRIICFKKSL
ncbi:aminoglycoside 6'-N-acetyltransferase [Clostridium sp. N3C]|uniref:aminoglycoside 6'-N-acetyltransferase n=1 Tax=Clostridium sp. N3C TaxID=1776758 RepID=UPI003594889A